MTRFFPVLVAVVLLLPYAPAAGADMVTRRSGRIRLTYQREDAPFADRTLAIVIRASPGLIADIGITPADTLRIHVAGTRHEFRTFTAAAIPDWGEGYAVPDLNLIVLKSPRIDGTVKNLRETTVHELAHVLLHGAMRSADIPRWLDEGFAMYAAKEWGFWDRASLVLTVLSGNLTPLGEIHAVNTFSRRKAQLAYQESALAVQFILVRYGRTGLRTLLRNLRETGGMNRALLATFGISIVEFEREWAGFMKKEYGWNALTGELFSTTLWGGLVVLFLLAYMQIRWRRRRILRRWEREERAEGGGSAEEDAWNRMKREWRIEGEE